MINYVFVKHRTEVLDSAWAESNEKNNVWTCDCVKVYGYTCAIAGTDENTTPAPRYSSQVAEHAVIGGSRVLKHHVLVGRHA